MKIMLVASLILLSLNLCGCQEKPTMEELLSGYEYTLDQLANYAMESRQEAEAQVTRGEMSNEQLAAQYQQINLIWASTLEDIDREKQYRVLWPLIFGSDEPPTLPQSPANLDLLQWTSYIAQLEEYIFMHYQLVDAAWKKLGYS